MGSLAAILSFFMACGFTFASSQLSQNLGSSSWMVHNGNLSVKVNASVPGGIYSDLRSAGVLTEDIFYRFNDLLYRWVATDNWTYTTTFDVDSKLLKKNNVVLEFEGLDTVARVLLNGNFLGETDNMFVLYRFDAKSFLQVTNNTLEVQFTSPIWAGQQATAELPYAVPPSCTPDEYHGECHVNYLRKMQASFAWDWGPAFPSVGIWKNVSLQAYNTAHARYVAVETKPTTKDWKVSVTLYTDVEKPMTGTLTATLQLHNSQIVYSREVSISPQQNSSSLVFSVLKVRLPFTFCGML